MLASMTASPRSDFPPACPCRSRYRAAARGLIEKQRESRCDQRGHEQPFVRLDRDLNPGPFTVVMLGQQLQQLAEPSRVIGDTGPRDDPGLVIDDGHLVLSF